MSDTEEHWRLLEAALDNIENEYQPTCETVNYGNGCPGATDASLEFWRRAADCVPGMLKEIRERRAKDMTSEQVTALGFVHGIVRSLRFETDVARTLQADALAVLDRLLRGGK